jgi:hypothetical protein
VISAKHRTSLFALPLFALPVLMSGWALSQQAPARHYQQATVLQVERSRPTLPYRRRIADSPPPPTEFDFRVTFQIDCNLYEVLYETPTDYLPSTIAAGKTADISIGKHAVYVRAPGDREIRMETLRRYRADVSCGGSK